MRGFHAKILTLGLVVLAASPAFAQRQPGGRGGRGGAMDASRLLTIEAVQTELKLTDDQKAAITKITDKYKDDIATARADRSDAGRAKMTELRKSQNDDLTKALPDILKPDQVKREKQLLVQAAREAAFTKDDVVTALKLTDDQQKSIKESAAALSKDIMDLMANAGQGADRTAAFTKARTMRQEGLDKIVNGLTDDQKKIWKDLTGDKFDFPAPQGRQGGNRTPRTTTPPATPPKPATDK
jgi:Spy/CpxP family protein refolding chaperone